MAPTTPPTTSDVLGLDERARTALRANDRGGYTVPCRGLYPFQWNWDSAFAAWGWATFDIDRAWTELETLFAGQWSSGMLPHIVFHQPDAGYFPGPERWSAGHVPPTSGITQPPVIAIVMRMLIDLDREVSLPRARGLFQKAMALHRWWHDERCRRGFAVIVHPWESGRDNAAAWDVGMRAIDASSIEPYERRDTDHVDASMRPSADDYDRFVAIVEYGREVGWDQRRLVDDGPFAMADPAVTFILARAHRDLASTARLLGEPDAELERWADRLVDGAEQLWNENLSAYDSFDVRAGTPGGSATASLFTEYLVGKADERTDAQLAAMLEAAPLGLATHDPRDPGFEPRRYWRGPTWPVVNALVALGLRSSGRVELETVVRDLTAALIARGGFAEYFDPTDGTPCGGSDFSWTAAVWLAWASPSAHDYGPAA